jgi:hypothetical protein
MRSTQPLFRSPNRSPPNRQRSVQFGSVQFDGGTIGQSAPAQRVLLEVRRPTGCQSSSAGLRVEEQATALVDILRGDGAPSLRLSRVFGGCQQLTGVSQGFAVVSDIGQRVECFRINFDVLSLGTERADLYATEK